MASTRAVTLPPFVLVAAILVKRSRQTGRGQSTRMGLTSTLALRRVCRSLTAAMWELGRRLRPSHLTSGALAIFRMALTAYRAPSASTAFTVVTLPRQDFPTAFPDRHQVPRAREWSVPTSQLSAAPTVSTGKAQARRVRACLGSATAAASLELPMVRRGLE